MKMFAELKTEINQSAALQELLPVNWWLSVACRPQAATSVTCNRLHCLHTWAHGREGAREANRNSFFGVAATFENRSGDVTTQRCCLSIAKIYLQILLAPITLVINLKS